MVQTLVSPGISIAISDESFYNSSTPGTVPLIVLATASNKAAPGGVGIAPATAPAQAGTLSLMTSQRELIQNFGNPKFYTFEGTPLHGNELNEYGLWTAYTYLGVNNLCYILRADLDLGQLVPAANPPAGAPLPGTYWFDLSQTQWGTFRANGSSSPASAWNMVSVKIAGSSNVDDSNIPLSGFGSNGDICVSPATDPSNLFYEKIGGTWYLIGSSQWLAARPTVVTGTATSGTMVVNNSLVINGVTVVITQTTLAHVATDINNANITNISAAMTGGGALQITNTAGTAITLANGTGTPLATLGLTEGTVNGVSVTRNSNATYPSGDVAGSIWIKGNPSHNGAKWSVKYYNGALGAFTLVSAPFYAFTSTLTDGDANKDTAALLALRAPATGSVYVGYDVATGAQELRRWSGTQWESLSYEASLVAPTTPPAAGTLWFDSNLSADIMVSNGSNWIGYAHFYTGTDPKGPQLSASPPLTQSDGTTDLVDNDLWIDTSDTENYPSIYRWNTSTAKWEQVDNTDNSTPLGIVFADARMDSGPTFAGITNAGSYTYNSTMAADLALSDYVDPDAPNPLLYPAGTMLFNTRYSGNSVKAWTPDYFRGDGLDDYTVNTYYVGGTSFTFPALASGDRWVKASGNKADGSPNMGRRAQRVVIVNALGAVLTANEEIRSEIVFFNLVAAPGYPEMIPDMITLNVDMKHVAFAIGDTPARLPPDGTSIAHWANNAANAVTTGEDGLTVADDYVGVYYPWGLGTNYDGTEIMIPPSAIALVTMAYNDQVAYPWYAPAGFTRGLVTNASSVGYLNNGEYTSVILNQGQRDVLYINKINPIAYIPHRGLVVYGQKTLDPLSSALDRINVARLINYIVYHLDNLMKPFLFEQNTAYTRAAAKASVERFFSQLVGLNGLYDYAVVCDTTNNTPDTIDANELWVDCAIQPVRAIEFIFVPIRILNTQGATNI